MKKIFYSLVSLLLVLSGASIGFEVQAQSTNYARTATATAVSYTAPWNWNRINDGSKSACGNQEAFVWTSGSATPTPYMQWEWKSSIAINQFVIYHAQNNTRYLLGGTIQRYDSKSSSWVNHHTWRSTSQNCITTVDFDVIIGDRVRITNFVYGTGQTSNPNFMEIEIYVTTLGTNNAGVSSINELNPCTSKQDIIAEINNQGTNRIDSVDVNYQINGGAIKTLKYNSGSSYDIKDTLGSPSATRVTLESGFAFKPNTTYDFKIWTSSPNGKKDTVNMNDTLYSSFDFYGEPANPTTQDIKQCGGGFPTLIGKSSAGGKIIWHHESNLDLVLGVGDTATLSKKYYPERRVRFIGRTLAGGNATMDNSFTQNWSYTGGASPQDKGYYWDIKPVYDLVFEGFSAALTNTGGPLDDVQVDVYYKNGTHVGSETNPSNWTYLGTDVVDCPATLNRGTYSDSVKIELPGIFLKANSTYGFYLMVRDVPQAFRTNCEQTGSRGGTHMNFTAGTLSAGDWASIARTTGFIPEIEIDYTFGCVSDTVGADLDIYERPIGANFLQGKTFEGDYKAGTMVNTDIVAEDSTVVYELNPPTKYPNSTFGKDWVVTALNIESINGTPVPASDTSTTPIGSSNGTLSYTPSKGWADSTIRVQVVIQELKNGCDTVVERYIFIAPTAEVDFSFVNGCLGTPIEFRNLSTISSGYMTYNWDFGDGNSSTFNEPIHNYQKEGKYNVTLEVVSGLGIRSSKTIVVEVFEIPKVDFRVLHACEGENVRFVNNTTISSGSIDYTWDFGDGTKSKLEDPTHLYAKPGGYRVTLVAFSNGCESKLSKNANQFARPTAAFTAAGECSGTPVTINNQSTIELGEGIGSYWIFGDGEFGTLFAPEHTYASPGTYTIKYKAISQFGCTDSAQSQVTIKEGPVAGFSYDKACNIDPVNFTNESSEPNGANTIYEWTFGDGQNSTAKDPSHVYPRLGNKVVMLKAISDNGCSDEYSETINIQIQPVAGFIVQDACSGERAIFVNTTEAAGNTSYKWYFGDGDSSELNSPKHIYSAPETRTYNVRLLASVDGGCTDEFTSTINVKEQPTCGFTAAQSSNDRATWTFTPDNATYGPNAYTWVLKGSKTYTDVSPTHTFEFTESDYTVILRVLTAEGCECIDSNTVINTSWNVGVVDLNEIGIDVRPNPSNGIVYLYSSNNESSTFHVEVIDMQGKVVKSEEEMNITTNGEKMDLGHLATGVYQIRLYNDRVQAVQKLIIR